jgi:hypothetical protein
LRKIQKMHFLPKWYHRKVLLFEKHSENGWNSENGWIEKLMVPSESAAQQLSNEWSRWYVSTILAISVSYPWSQKSPSALKRLKAGSTYWILNQELYIISSIDDIGRFVM